MNYNNNRVNTMCPFCKSPLIVNPANPYERCPFCNNRFETQRAIAMFHSVSNNNINRINNQNYYNQIPNAQRPIQRTNLVPAICPQCHGQVQINPDNETAVCQFCGTKFIVDKAINNYYNINTTNIQNHAKKGAVESLLYYKDQQMERMYRDSERNRERIHEIMSDPDKFKRLIIFLIVIFGVPIMLFVIPILMLNL